MFTNPIARGGASILSELLKQRQQQLHPYGKNWNPAWGDWRNITWGNMTPEQQKARVADDKAWQQLRDKGELERISANPISKYSAIQLFPGQHGLPARLGYAAAPIAPINILQILEYLRGKGLLTGDPVGFSGGEGAPGIGGGGSSTGDGGIAGASMV